MTQQSHYWSYTLRLSISVVSYSLWPIDCSLAGSSVHGISQARIWVAISFSRRSSWPGSWPCISCIGRQILYHWATWETKSGVWWIHHLAEFGEHEWEVAMTQRAAVSSNESLNLVFQVDCLEGRLLNHLLVLFLFKNLWWYHKSLREEINTTSRQL